MAVDDININVKVSGTEQLKALSHAMRQLNAGMVDSTASVANLDARAKSLSTALGRTDKGMSDHAKTVGQLLTNQRALGGEMRNVNKDIGQLTTGLAVNGKNAKENAASLRVYNESLKGIKARAFKEDLAGITQEMRRLGKDAQFTGRAMTVGLTVPLLAFGRLGLQSVTAVDKQLTRINKILENTARTSTQAFEKMGIAGQSHTAAQIKSANDMVARYKLLDDSLTAISQEYGTARDLVIGLAGDFAELGLVANESSVKLAELTVQAEKLGDLNITGAKDLVQTMYQNATTALVANADARNEVLTGMQREKMAVDIAYTQLAAFNQIENVTALSLRDIAKALPEVAATATAFGISMTEVTAILAPMKAAGFDVGASATAIKVSLQRLNAPTKQTRDMMDQLAKTTGYDFPAASGIGINSIDRLARAFTALSQNARNAQGDLYGTEGALEFFSQMFGVRQSTRMEVAIRDLSSFNMALRETSSQEGVFASTANKTIEAQNKTTKSNLPLIKSFSDLGNIARMSAAKVGDTIEILDEAGKSYTQRITRSDIDAATKVRNETADMILKSRKQGNDLLAKVSSQAGKALLVEFAGGKANIDLAEQELKAANSTIDASIQRVKNNFKFIAASIIENLRPVLEFVDRWATKIANFFNSLSAPARTTITAFLGFIAILGPLKMGVGAVQVAFATIFGSLLKFIPGLSGLTAGAVSASGQLMYLNAPLVAINGNIETTASRFSVLVAKLASGDGAVSSVAKKFGLFTGILQSNVTASAEVVAAVEEVTFVLGKQQATLAKSSSLMSLEAGQTAAHKASTDIIISDINKRIAADSVLLANTVNNNGLQEAAFRQYGATFGLTSKEIEAAILANNTSSTNNAAVVGQAYASKTKSILAVIAANEKEAESVLKTDIALAKKELGDAQRLANTLKREASDAAKMAEKDSRFAASAAAELQLNLDRQVSAQATANSVIAAHDEEVIRLAAAEQEKRAIFIASAEFRLAQLRIESAAMAEVEAERLKREASASIRNPSGQFLSKAAIAENAAKREAAEKTGILQEKGFLRPRIPKGEPGAGQFVKGVYPDLGAQESDRIASLLLQEKSIALKKIEIEELERYILKQRELLLQNPLLVESEQLLAEAVTAVSGALSTESATIKELVTGAINPHIASQQVANDLNEISIKVTEASAIAADLEAKSIISSTAANDLNTLSTNANSEAKRLNDVLTALQIEQTDLLAKNKGKLTIAHIDETTLLNDLSAAIMSNTISIDGNGNAVGGAAAAYRAWEQTVLSSADMSLVYKLSLENVNSTLAEQIALIMADAEAEDFLHAARIRNAITLTEMKIAADAATVSTAAQTAANNANAASQYKLSLANTAAGKSFIKKPFVAASFAIKKTFGAGADIATGVAQSVKAAPQRIANAASAGIGKIVGQKSLIDLETASIEAESKALKLNNKLNLTRNAINAELATIIANDTVLQGLNTAARDANNIAIAAANREAVANLALNELIVEEATANLALTEAQNALIAAQTFETEAGNLAKAASKEVQDIYNAGLKDTTVYLAAVIAEEEAFAVAIYASEVANIANTEATLAQTAATSAQAAAKQALFDAEVFAIKTENATTAATAAAKISNDANTIAIESNTKAKALNTAMTREQGLAEKASVASTNASTLAMERQAAVAAGASAKGSGIVGFQRGIKNKIIGQTGVKGVKAVAGVAEADGVAAVAAVKGVTAVKGTGIKGLIGAKAVKAVAADAASGAEAVAAKAGTGLLGIGSKITGLVKSFFSLGGVLKMIKFALIGTFAIAAIVVVVGVVAMLVKAFKKFPEALKPVQDGLKYLKDAFFAVITPIKDAIATLLGFGGKGGSNNPGKHMQEIGEKIKSVAKAVSDFVIKTVVPIIEKVMISVINIIKGIVKIVKGFINVFQGDWKEGLGQILQGVSTVFRAILKVIKMSIGFQITIFQKGIDLIIGMFFGLGKAIVQAIGGAVEWVLNKFADIGDSLPSWIPGVKGLTNALRGVGKAISDTADGFGETVDGWAKKVTSVADKVVGFGKNIIDGLFNTGDTLLNKISSDWVDKIKGAGDAMGKAAEKEAPKVTQIYTDAAGSGLDKAAEEAGFKIRDLKQKFADAALGIIGESMKDAVDQMSKALESQKSAALSVYDTQLETINKLEKAEQSLTQEMQYQSDRRRMIAERALQVENYQRNRALAIYEGRIDDARVLSLEDASNKISFTENITKLDTDRQKSLAAENLATLRDNIAKAKDETAKFFDETIKNFQEAAAEITKFPPLTVEQYGNQLDSLNEVATAAANKNGDTFKEMMSNLVTHLSEDLPNQGVPVFTTALDSLVAVATEKYGLGKGAGNDTIIGATLGMLMGITGQITENSSSIVSAFGSIVGDIQGTAALGLDILTNGIVQPALDALTMVMVTHNPFEVFANACTAANLQLLYDTQKIYGAVGGLVDGLGNNISELVAGLGLANFLQDQLGNATSPPGPGEDGYTYGVPTGMNFAGSGAGGGYTSRLYANRFGPVTLDPAFGAIGAGRRGSPSIAAPKIGAFNGGYIRKFGYGGFNVPGAESQGINALLHGGEFVINAAAVRNIGMATLTGLNNMRFQKPVDSSNYNVSGGTNSTSTVNIIVDNFIGEDQWFNELIKKYNMNVVPRNQKSAGLEGRVLTSYSGLSRGM